MAMYSALIETAQFGHSSIHSYTHIHVLMAEAAMQCANQLMRSNQRFRVFLKDTTTRSKPSDY